MYSANLFTENSKNLNDFLNKFYEKEIKLNENLKFEAEFENFVGAA